MGPVAYVLLVVAVAVAGAVLLRRRGAPRAVPALVLVVAVAAVVAPAVLAWTATRAGLVDVDLPGRPLQTVARAGSVFVFLADGEGRPVLSARDPADGRERFTVRGDDPVVADDGSLLVRSPGAFVAFDAAGRRTWVAPDPPSGRRQLVIAFAAGRAVLADRSPGPGDAVRYVLRGIDATGRTAWTRTFLGSDSPFAEVPEAFGASGLREDITDLAVLDVERADWDGRELRGADAYLDLDGRVLPGPTGDDTRFLWARDGRLVVGRRLPGDACRLEGYAEARRVWVSDDCRAFSALRPTTVRDEPVFRDEDGRLRRVDPATGEVVDLQTRLEPVPSLPCLRSGDPQGLAPTNGRQVLTVSGRTVTAFPLADRDGPDLTHVVGGAEPFRACLGSGTVTITTEVRSRNPFLRGTLRRVEVFDTGTGRRTASALLRGEVRATDGWAPGRALVLREDGDSALLGA